MAAPLITTNFVVLSSSTEILAAEQQAEATKQSSANLLQSTCSSPY